MNGSKINISFLNLSTRALNCCKTAGIHNLSDLLNYYANNLSFEHLRNCGKKTNIELLHICHRYKKQNNNTKESEFERFLDGLSVRAFNCINANFSSKEDFRRYYCDFQNFLNLKNIGMKTNDELLEFCREKFEDISKEKEFTNFPEIYSGLDSSQFESLKSYYILNLSIASPRLQKLVQELNVENFNLPEIISKFEQIDLCAYYNIGKTTLKEFDTIIRDCCDYIEGLLDSKKAFEIISTILIDQYFLALPEVEKYREPFFKNRFPLFNLILQLFSKDKLFNKIETSILWHRFKYFKNTDTLSLEEIAEETGLTRERIRQLQVCVEKKVTKTFAFLLHFKQHISYPLNLDEDIVIINNSNIHQININENTNFTIRFFAKIFNLLLIGTHQVLHDSINKNCFLIRRELYNHFDFDVYFEDLYKRFSANIKETYSFNFDGYLLKFWKSNLKLDHFPKIKNVAEVILFEAFGSIVDNDGKIEFRKNTPLTLREIVPQILEKEKRPLSIKELKNIIEKDYLLKLKSIDQLRASILANDRIISLSRTSTYGLVEWHDAIKGGTIKSIVYELLNNANEPMSIYTITSHVNKYRNTNSSNILGNLRADPKKSFIFFNSNLVGLMDKNYQNIYYDFKKLNPTIYKGIIQFFRRFDGEFNISEAIAVLSSCFTSIHEIQLKVIVQNYLERGVLEEVKGKIFYYGFEKENRLN